MKKFNVGAVVKRDFTFDGPRGRRDVSQFFVRDIKGEWHTGGTHKWNDEQMEERLGWPNGEWTQVCDGYRFKVVEPTKLGSVVEVGGMTFTRVYKGGNPNAWFYSPDQPLWTWDEIGGLDDDVEVVS